METNFGPRRTHAVFLPAVPLALPPGAGDRGGPAHLAAARRAGGLVRIGQQFLLSHRARAAPPRRLQDAAQTALHLPAAARRRAAGALLQYGAGRGGGAARRRAGHDPRHRLDHRASRDAARVVGAAGHSAGRSLAAHAVLRARAGRRMPAPWRIHRRRRHRRPPGRPRHAAAAHRVLPRGAADRGRETRRPSAMARAPRGRRADHAPSAGVAENLLRHAAGRRRHGDDLRRRRAGALAFPEFAKQRTVPRCPRIAR